MPISRSLATAATVFSNAPGIRASLNRDQCVQQKKVNVRCFFALNCSNTFDAGQCKPSNSDASYRCSMWQRRFRGDLVVLVEFEKC